MTRNFFHLLRIVRVLVKYNLDEMVRALNLFRTYGFILRLIPVGRSKKP